VLPAPVGKSLFHIVSYVDTLQAGFGPNEKAGEVSLNRKKLLPGNRVMASTRPRLLLVLLLATDEEEEEQEEVVLAVASPQ